MKCRNFIWGRVRRSEKIIHKIQTTPNTLSIFTAQLRDCNSFPRAPRAAHRAERGAWALCSPTSYRKKDVLFTQKRGARKKKSTTDIKGFSGTAHHQILSAATKDVRDLSTCRVGGKACGVQKCPSTNTGHQPMSNKHSKGKATADPGKMEGDKTSNALLHTWASRVGSNQGEQMFTRLQWLVEMGTSEVILHSKFCSKLNQATKPAIKCGAKSHFLHQFSFGKSKGPHTRAGRRNLQALRMINREGLLTLL